MNAKYYIALSRIQSQLSGGIWSMNSAAHKAFEQRIAALLEADVDDPIPDNETNSIVTPNTIAIVPVHGDIVYNTGLPSDICDLFGVCDLSNLQAMLRAVKNEPSITNVVLDVNSPGGTVCGLKETAELVKALTSQCDVTVFAHGIMASAAYYIAVNADNGIAVTPSAWVGSVGTRADRVDISTALKKEDIEIYFAASSPKKYWGDPRYPLSTDEKAFYDKLIADLTADFKSTVLGNRKIDEALLDGSIFIGADAVTNGFADLVVNSIDELIESLTETKNN